LKAAASRRSKATVGSVPLFDALDFVTRHTRSLGKVGDGEAEGGADVIPDGGDARRTTVAGVDGERIRRKPVLDGWSTNTRSPPKRAEEPAGHRQDPGVVPKTGYLL
jgi:hypothetical protein